MKASEVFIICDRVFICEDMAAKGMGRMDADGGNDVL